MSSLLSVVVPAAIVVMAGYRRRAADGARSFHAEQDDALHLFAGADHRQPAETQVPAVEGLRIAAAFALSTVALYALVMAISVTGRLSKPIRTSLLATTIFPNTGNLGLSLTLLALGEAGLERAIVAYLCSAVLVFGLGPAMVSGEGLRRGLHTTVRLPLIWALLAGDRVARVRYSVAVRGRRRHRPAQPGGGAGALGYARDPDEPDAVRAAPAGFLDGRDAARRRPARGLSSPAG